MNEENVKSFVGIECLKDGRPKKIIAISGSTRQSSTI